MKILATGHLAAKPADKASPSASEFCRGIKDASPALAGLLARMTLATHATRVGGYIALRNRTPSLRAKAVREAAPGCVLISVIARRTRPDCCVIS